MITLISATNRPDSNTLKIAHYYLKKLSKKGIEHAFFFTRADATRFIDE